MNGLTPKAQPEPHVRWLSRRTWASRPRSGICPDVCGRRVSYGAEPHPLSP